MSATLATSQDQTLFSFAQNSRDEVRVQGDGTLAGALSANLGMKQTTYICETAHSGSNGLGVGESDVMPTLDTSCSKAVCIADDNANAAVDVDVAGTIKVGGSAPMVSCCRSGVAVRRLTPTECERLQGFPDGWTRIPYRGKPAEECPDGPRYKALGNSMAVPVMRWIGERIWKAEMGGLE